MGRRKFLPFGIFLIFFTAQGFALRVSQDTPVLSAQLLQKENGHFHEEAFSPLIEIFETEEADLLITFDPGEDPAAPCVPLLGYTEFHVTEVLSLGCGSFRYVATNSNARHQHLEVIDHTGRSCRDLVPHEVTATLYDETTKIPFVGELDRTRE